MTSKNCTKCGKLKLFSDFSKSKDYKSGFVNFCKKCGVIKARKHSRTRKGLTSQMYSAQKRCSKKRGHNRPNYSLLQLREWVLTQSNFEKLYTQWMESGYKKILIPSCDRIDDYKSYSLDNLRLVTWQENKQKWFFDTKNGVNNKQSKSVDQLTLSGNLIKTFHSICFASRQTGFSQGAISMCCLGKYKTLGGFLWRFT